ncbi:NAD(P)H-dependent oxidoreductase [Shimia sp. SDUM112013]|uniref:NAD(P)H-dependent oxidoreductase n=1 Tax=Shimia sp. SDUM112013 TaxID=3136160 RepID=UPI0032EE490F
MRTLVIFCHPNPESYNAAIKDIVVEELSDAGAEVRLHDLYAEGFDPLITREDLITHIEYPANTKRIAREVDDLKWCNSIIFIYPTWNQAMPAMLKGWMDRVLVAGVSFHMPEPGKSNPTAGLRHIKGLAVFTTGGSNWLLSFLIGHSGKRMLMRAFRAGLHPRARAKYVVKYRMNTATSQDLERHKDYVRTTTRKFAQRFS